MKNSYFLRLALLRAGYTPVPCHSGRPVVVPHGEVPESSILAWQNLNAPETGIYNRITGEVTIVDAVPLTEAELAVQAEAQERARAEAQAAAERAERRRRPSVERKGLQCGLNGLRNTTKIETKYGRNSSPR